MKKLITPKSVLIIAILLGSLLRLFSLGSFPNHLTNDEAALGYNAYSILKTGRDEHGALMPVVFQSFGDWKPGLYVYLAVPSVALLGLNEYSTRLPSAAMGIIAIYLLYKLVLVLTEDKWKASVSALVLALLPWHVHFSRGAWEANVALTILLAAILFFYKSLERNKYLIISAILFGLTLWTYQSAKLASALVLFGLIIFNLSKFKSINNKYLIYSFLAGVLISIPIALSVFNGKGGRIEVMSVFSYPRSKSYLEETIFSQGGSGDLNLTYYLFHSETFNFVRGVFGRYFNHFDGKYLFFEGDWSNPRHTSPYVGYILYSEIPFLFLGLFYLISKKLDKKSSFILYWLAVSPIPSALTRDSVHGIRSLNMLIPLSILIGIGLSVFFKYLARKNKIIFYSISFLTLSVTALSLVLYLDSYFIQEPVQDAKYYQYGYKQMVQKINKLGNNYDQIVVQQSYDQPYIYFLFFNKVDPASYQKQVSFQKSEYGDVGQVTSFGNIVFRELNWSSDKVIQNILMVGHDFQFPLYEVYSNVPYKVDTINYPDGLPAFLLVESNPEQK